MRNVRMQAAFAALALPFLLAGCFPRIHSIEHFEAVRGSSSLPLQWSQEDWGEGSPMTQLRGGPGVMRARWEGAKKWESLQVSILYRDTGGHWTGFMVPFVPLFGSGKDDAAFPIVVRIRLYGGDWEVDGEQLRLFLDETEVGLSPKAMLDWINPEYLFDATYEDAETLRVEFPLKGSDGSSHLVSVDFAKGEGRLNDHRSIAAISPRGSGREIHLMVHDPVKYPPKENDAFVDRFLHRMDGDPDAASDSD